MFKFLGITEIKIAMTKTLQADKIQGVLFIHKTMYTILKMCHYLSPNSSHKTNKLTFRSMSPCNPF